jgi:hypothetical protein
VICVHNDHSSITFLVTKPPDAVHEVLIENPGTSFFLGGGVFCWPVCL